jgi:hypothetical protein
VPTMSHLVKTVKKINNFFTGFLLFFIVLKTVKKINNFFTVFSRNSLTILNRQPRHLTFYRGQGATKLNRQPLSI